MDAHVQRWKACRTDWHSLIRINHKIMYPRSLATLAESADRYRSLIQQRLTSCLAIEAVCCIVLNYDHR